MGILYAYFVDEEVKVRKINNFPKVTSKEVVQQGLNVCLTPVDSFWSPGLCFLLGPLELDREMGMREYFTIYTEFN